LRSWGGRIAGGGPSATTDSLSQHQLAESDKSMSAFRRGLRLSELGFEERNITIEYRFADGQYDRGPTLATETVRAASPQPSASSWQELQASRIPVVFSTGGHAVAQGRLRVSIVRAATLPASAHL
jgi:hypothetical protein